MICFADVFKDCFSAFCKTKFVCKIFVCCCELVSIVVFIFVGLSALTGVAGAFQGQNNLGGQAGGSNQALGALTSSLGLGNLGGLGSLLSQGTGSSAGMNAYGTQSSQQGQFNGGSSNLGGGYTAGQQLSNYSITGQRSSSGGYSTQDSRGGGSGSGGGYGGYSSNNASSSGGGSSTAKTRVFVRNVSTWWVHFGFVLKTCCAFFVFDCLFMSLYFCFGIVSFSLELIWKSKLFNIVSERNCVIKSETRISFECEE